MTVLSAEDIQLQLTKRSQIHWPRKLWHVAWGVITLLSYFFFGLTSKQAALICLSVAALTFVLDFLRIKNLKFNQLVVRLMKSFMRASEVKKLTGLPFYALGMGLSFWLFKEPIAIISILFLTFSDPLSSIMGILFGEKQYLPSKTYMGSFTGICVCYLISFIYCYQNIRQIDGVMGFCLLAGFVGSFSEVLSVLGIDDNLTIPVVSGFGLSLLNGFFHFF